ncbi:MAG: hypothetical protein GMKNLPBB_00511 [Myxococcota bacterium]|nr:hypothetical protein [Myxococcota bacterium]
MERIIRILYEDKGAPASLCGLHQFILACLTDRIAKPEDNISFHRHIRKLKARIEPRLSGGSGNLRNNLRVLSDPGMSIAAFDSDRVHELLGLDKKTCREKVLNQLYVDCGSTFTARAEYTSPWIVLIERNLESVAEDACVVQNIKPENLRQNANKILLEFAKTTEKSSLRQKALGCWRRTSPDGQKTYATGPARIVEILERLHAREPIIPLPHS